ncbi:hypothetical protein [Streptomyces sp. UNOB3_S3]|uniref:hypothetical protein n=1 Tax=Streptomyces sp. UNOB3_S3 TaxID=2871682 RepID=UPI0035AE6A23
MAPAADAAHPQSASAAVARIVKAPGFNAGGTWTVYQTNLINATLTVAQDAQGNLTGTATNSNGATGPIEQGFVDGNYVYFVIPWSDGAKGRYIGSLDAGRHLTGATTNVNAPAIQATWRTERTF